MGVVKADAYGHGLIPAALAALAEVRPGWARRNHMRRWLLRKGGHRAGPLPHSDMVY